MSIRGFLVVLVAVVIPPVVVAQTYYVDAVAGNDTSNGLTPATAWQTLTRANATTFQPGDSLRLKRGSVWNNDLLVPRGSGVAGRPIVVTDYGTGNRPLINTAGQQPAAVRLSNQQFVRIENLEITNQHPTNSTATRYGVYVTATNVGVARHIILRNLSIHNVNADPSVKTCGGIFFEVLGSTTPTWFDSVIVEGCDVYDLSPVGIANNSSWATRTLTTNTNWTPSTNVILRNNTIRRTTRNGAIIRVSHRPIIEHNVFQECAKDSSGNALFVFNCDSATMQYNEAFLTRLNPGDDDAGGFDADYRCKSTIIQYNYSHDNEYGGIVVVSDASGATTFNDGTVVRYNVLKDNRHHILRTSGNVTRTTFYNNTISSSAAIGSAIVIWHKSWGGYADSTRYYNNIFSIQSAAASYSFGSSTANRFDFNLFFGIHPGSEPADAHKLTANPLFVAPESVGTGWSSAAGFRLQSTSPAINSGFSVPGHVTRDYLGNPVPVGAQVDRGAFEYQGPSSNRELHGVNVRVPYLANAYPNPFNPETHIRFSVAQTEFVTLKVHDVLGREVAALVSEQLGQGVYTASFNGANLSSGMYFSTLHAGPFVDTKRLMLLK